MFRTTKHDLSTYTRHEIDASPRTAADGQPEKTYLHVDYAKSMGPEAVAFHDMIKDEIMSDIDQKDHERQAIEDERAIKRNRNRLLTLVAALIIGLVVTYTLENGMWGPMGKTLAPYSFVITVAMDSMLAAYAYIKRY